MCILLTGMYNMYIINGELIIKIAYLLKVKNVNKSLTGFTGYKILKFTTFAFNFFQLKIQLKVKVLF